MVAHRRYALKQIRRSTVIRKHQENFVQSERKLLGLVHSPFIVNLVRTFKDETSVCVR